MPDTQAEMTDDLQPEPPFLTALMQEIIPKPPRSFILVPNSTVNQFRIPTAIYNMQNVYPVCLTCMQKYVFRNVFWGSQ